MSETPERCTKEVTLKAATKVPYNRFTIQYTVAGTVNGAGKNESDRTLAYPMRLGLNLAWLHNDRAPVDRAADKRQKETITSLHLDFPYWGHLIDTSIRDFNKSSSKRCRKLVYDLRHGEADHNAWKSLFKKDNPLLWTKDPEHKRQPIIAYDQKKYCIIDPPLTANGVQQAECANKMFRRLKQHMFPMPKRAYVSPLLRTMQTFKHGLKSVDIGPDDCYILDDLREQETGNCADILIDEYTSRDNPKKPPKAGTGGRESYMEDDDKVKKRAASLQDKIFKLDDSDCIVRVTHSLLIQNNLKTLVAGGEEVLTSFMLAEGGLFAYVIEGDRPAENEAKRLRKSLQTVAKRWEQMDKRRESAFQGLPRKPAAVTIEPPILAVYQKDVARTEKRLDPRNKKQEKVSNKTAGGKSKVPEGGKKS